MGSKHFSKKKLVILLKVKMKTIKKLALIASLTAAIVGSGSAAATTFTSTSPYGVNVTSVGATTVGGIVIDLVGVNGAHVVSEISASTLYNGYSTANFVIGSQGGFSSGVTGALGGGLASAAFRFTLEDGDTASGNFDYNKNTLLVNNIVFGNWSAVAAQNTDASGVLGAAGMSAGGFRDNVLDTGWFASNNAALMSSLFSSITSTHELMFSLNDTTPGDNLLNFTRGLDGSLINVGQAPVVASAVPEPTSIALLGLGLLGFGAARRRESAVK